MENFATEFMAKLDGKLTPEQMKTVLDAFADQFLHGEETRDPFKDFTRGHFKRGVE